MTRLSKTTTKNIHDCQLTLISLLFFLYSDKFSCRDIIKRKSLQIKAYQGWKYKS